MYVIHWGYTPLIGRTAIQSRALGTQLMEYGPTNIIQSFGVLLIHGSHLSPTMTEIYFLCIYHQHNIIFNHLM